MDKNVHKVYIKDHSNSYINGRISGIMIALCDDDRVYANYIGAERPDDLVMRVRTTDENWSKITGLIENHYPGLCDFE